MTSDENTTLIRRRAWHVNSLELKHFTTCQATRAAESYYTSYGEWRQSNMTMQVHEMNNTSCSEWRDSCTAADYLITLLHCGSFFNLISANVHLRTHEYTECIHAVTAPSTKVINYAKQCWHVKMISSFFEELVSEVADRSCPSLGTSLRSRLGQWQIEEWIWPKTLHNLKARSNSYTMTVWYTLARRISKLWRGSMSALDRFGLSYIWTMLLLYIIMSQEHHTNANIIIFLLCSYKANS